MYLYGEANPRHPEGRGDALTLFDLIKSTRLWCMFGKQHRAAQMPSRKQAQLCKCSPYSSPLHPHRTQSHSQRTIMIFFSRKTKTSSLPPGWPSPYHNKCSQRDCLFPNSPQTVKGVYQCQSIPGCFYCEGTYKISSSRAQESERYLKEMAARCRAVEEEQRKRTVSEMRRPDLGHRRRDVGPVHYNALDDRTRSAYGQPPRTVAVRPNETRRPQIATSRRPSYAGHKPSQAQIEQEYMTDQIMMHLYPERQIHPRWI